MVVVVALVAVVSLRGPSMTHVLSTKTYEDLYYLPPPDMLQVLSFGHREAAADLAWMKGLVYIGNEFEHRGALQHVFRYADTIVALDPDFRRAYSWGATMGLYRPVSPTLDDAVRAVSYLDHAATRFPDDPEIAWQRAAAWSYELPSFTQDVEEKKRFREIGAEHMVLAARLGGGPAWLALTNATQLEALGQMDRAIHHLAEMHAMTQDEELRAQIEARLEQMRADARLEALRAAERELLEDASRQYPWLPIDFFVLVRSPRPVSSD
ncbi:MAG: hypothetical protein MUE69_05735 [Myxococcota bacterium]|nr:hypothetical protein [Myxococcota bacterium]